MTTEAPSVNLVAAIKSLDTLNDQIVQFIFTPAGGTTDPDSTGDPDLPPCNQHALRSSMVLLRKLLVDSQIRFRTMVEDNVKLAAKIDSSIHIANEEVNNLREELMDTNRHLNKMCDVTNIVDMPPSNGKDEMNNKELSTQSDKELNRLQQHNTQLQSQLNSLQEQLHNMKENYKNDSKDCDKMSTRSSARAHAHIPMTSLNKPAMTSLPKQASSFTQNATDESKVNELKLDLLQTRQELNRTKEALLVIKVDRKRLKGEKLDLLNQMKQLYCTLEDKESELREFIRTYEQKMKETEANIKQFAIEKEECEHDKWEILKRARDAAERSVALRAELDLKDQHIKRLDTQLAQAQDKLNAIGHNVTSTSTSRDMLTSSTEDILIPYHHHNHHQVPPPPDPPRMYRSDDSAYASYAHTQSNGSIGNIQGLAESSRSSEEFGDTIYSQIPPINLSASTTGTPVPSHRPRSTPSQASYSVTKKKRKSFSTLSKMFGKSRSRRSIAVSDPSILEEHIDNHSPRLSILTPENYQEKLSLLERAKQIRMEHWKASYVLAWLEIEMNMPVYGKSCAENIKSGQILLGLNDVELESALKLTSPLHRRKLRLAIEELQNPALSLYKKAAYLDHTWVAHCWVRHLGLSQYCSIFDHHLIDGRLLNVLTKKDLEKHLGMTRKFHHASILHGIELLRIMHFDKETFTERRQKCADTDDDPLVWSNQRLIKWIRDIDLEEYADNLLESGVHGAVLVLESTFNSEAMAAALGIPHGKSYVRRHLAAELDALIKPARAALEFATHISRKKYQKSSSGGSLGRTFLRSYRGGMESPNRDNSKTRASNNSNKKITFRGSLGRALGRRAKLESDTYSPPTYPAHNSNRSSHRQNSHSVVNISKPIPQGPEIEAEGTTV